MNRGACHGAHALGHGAVADSFASQSRGFCMFATDVAMRQLLRKFPSPGGIVLLLLGHTNLNLRALVLGSSDLGAAPGIPAQARCWLIAWGFL